MATGTGTTQPHGGSILVGPSASQVLIAAGFRAGFIDEVPSYISSEPNLETDMDRWSAWFDLLKATLEVIEEELIKG